MKKLLTLTVALLLLALCGVCAFAAKDAPVVVDHVVYQLIAEKNNLPQVLAFVDEQLEASRSSRSRTRSKAFPL